ARRPIAQLWPCLASRGLGTPWARPGSTRTMLARIASARPRSGRKRHLVARSALPRILRRTRVPLAAHASVSMIVGTAGHIDHGKTTLETALTSVEYDLPNDVMTADN